MKKTVWILLADGFEEIEAVTPIDILRRAGLDVKIAGVGKSELTGAHGLRIRADLELDKAEGLPDAVVLPGGAQGAANLRDSASVTALLEKMKTQDRTIAAICASPGVVLAKTNILEGKKATSYPGYEKNFKTGTTFSEARVVTDGRVITSRGPGTAFEFSLELVRQLVDVKTAETIQQQTLSKV